jgi:hypothetical protein
MLLPDFSWLSGYGTQKYGESVIHSLRLLYDSGGKTGGVLVGKSLRTAIFAAK